MLATTVDRPSLVKALSLLLFGMVSMYWFLLFNEMIHPHPLEPVTLWWHNPTPPIGAHLPSWALAGDAGRFFPRRGSGNAKRRPSEWNAAGMTTRRCLSPVIH